MGSQVAEHNRVFCEKTNNLSKQASCASTLQHQIVASKLLECYTLIKRDISGIPVDINQPMKQFKLDLSKLFDLQVLLIEADPDLLHLFKQMLLNLGIKKIETARQIDELLGRETPVNVDIIFLDYAVDTQLTGGEIVDQLIQHGILPNRTRLVLMAQQNDRAQYAIEYPYHLISYLERPFNKVTLDQELKQHVLFYPQLRPLLTLAGIGRYADCLKLLLHTQSQPLPSGLEQILQRLRVQLLLDLHKFDAVIPLLKAPIAEQQGWALWALFRVRYERGDLTACQAFLTDSSEELARYMQRRELWLIYLALQERDYAAALQVVNKIPAVGMSSNLVRLVHLVMILADEFERAQDFIERKRRLAVRGELYVQLSIAQTRAVLWQLQHSEAEQRPALLSQLEQLQTQIRQDKTAAVFSVSVRLLEAHIWQFLDSTEKALQLIQDHLREVQWQQQPAYVLCHAALVFHSLQQTQLAADLLFYADNQIQSMLDNCHRVFIGCLHQHAFDLVYPAATRSIAYQQMASRYVQQQNLLAAAKMLRRACRYEPQNQTLRQALYKLMQQLGIQRFRGINLPQEQT